MASEKRRSDRVMLTLPLLIRFVDEKGRQVECEGRTTSINRHGARIRVSRPLPDGQVVRLVNIANLLEADFRVIGLVAPVTDQGATYGVLGPMQSPPMEVSECGVECLDTNIDFWGIRFPPPEEGEGFAPKALLDCRGCHTISLRRLSLVEIDVLDTAGTLTLHCEVCGRLSPCGYADHDLAAAGEPSGEPAAAPAPGMSWRRHQRVALQLPILVRKYSGTVEISHTEDVSKGGFSFVSGREYQIGEGIRVACPYTEGGPNIEVQAQVLRTEPIQGTTSTLYGVRYSRPVE